MFYEKIKVIDIQNMTVDNITPNYTADKYDFETDKLTGEKIHYAYGVNIIKTPEQVYEEWQEQQSNYIPLPKVEERITNIESYLVDQVEKQYVEVANNV